MKKECVIIGSGLGGLSAGVILSKNGYRVTVLEQETQVGGCLQCFIRKGAKFETGMHFIGSAGRGEVLYRILKYLGVTDDVTLSRMDEDGYEVMSFGGRKYAFPNGRENFIRRFAEEFPSQKENLIRYFDVVDSIASASSLHNMSNEKNENVADLKYQLMSIDSILDEIFTDEQLQKVVVGNLPLYAAIKGKTPFSTHAFITDFYNRSAWRVVGGSDQLAMSMRKTIEEAGGLVLCRQKVVEIITDGEKATAVKTTDGTIYPADVVVSDIHPKRLLEIVGSPILRPAYRHRIDSLPETTGCFTVYLKFKEKATPYLNYNYYGYRGDTPWNCEIYTPEEWPKGYLYMHMCAEERQTWAKSGVIVSYMNIRDVEKWKNTKTGRRGKDYELFKHEKAEKLLDLVEADFPDIRKQTEEYWTSTPLTYLDYTGTAEGSMYGIAKDVTLGPSCRVHHRTKIPNLLLTGQNINSHGIMGVLVGTIVACSELFTSAEIIRQINAASEE